MTTVQHSISIPCTQCFLNTPYWKWHFRVPDCVPGVVFLPSEHWPAQSAEALLLHFHSEAETIIHNDRIQYEMQSVHAKADG